VRCRCPFGHSDVGRRNQGNTSVRAVDRVEQHLKGEVGSGSHSDGQDLDTRMIRVAIVSHSVVDKVSRRCGVGRKLDRVCLGKGCTGRRAQDLGLEALTTEFKSSSGTSTVDCNRSVGLHTPLNLGTGSRHVVLQQDLLSAVDESNSSVKGSIARIQKCRSVHLDFLAREESIN